MDIVEPAKRRGILGQMQRLDRWLDLIFVILLLSSALRYHERHDLFADGLPVLLGTAGLVVAYALRPLANKHGWSIAWSLVVVALWALLTLIAPSFAWCSVPLAFAVLQMLPFTWAAVVISAMMLTITVGWLSVGTAIDPTLIAGPIGIGLVTVIVYRALERESTARAKAVEELLQAQEDLASEQRRTGAIAERARLSRDIHDSIGQDLSSINLFLQAAEQSWGSQAARDRVHTAAQTARGALDTVRRVVRDLAEESLSAVSPGALRSQLEAIIAQPCAGTDLGLRFEGEARPLPADLAEAVIFTVRGALANVRDHAAAGRAMVTLTFDDDALLLDIRDDGRGFTPQTRHAPALRGHGLPGLRRRVLSLGGSFTVESSPGEGTSLSVVFPWEEA
ncbi:sensor histidine kinase [Glutamicibacter sp.]|uniref:sensor histidine kinase n=1 Tax=Glutamicibacter sp. TaxID=1931995 RepID=UPI0028BD6276|nr:sensor histidine kinase [Glutamicibacter sp.]